jgi:DNA-binding NarL/FixJ family response regulator
VIRVMVADDHPLVRCGLETVLDSAPDLVHCGSADRGDAAVRLALVARPDVLIIDVTMPGGDGIEATRVIRGALPDTRVIVLTWDLAAGGRAVAAGAEAFLLKDVDPIVLLAHIRAGVAPLLPR